MKYKVLAFLGILLILSGCGKYEDGPGISFRNANFRIQGWYEIVSLTRNGIDITQQWKDSCDWVFRFNDYSDTRLIENALTVKGKLYPSDTSSCFSMWSDFSLNESNTNLVLNLNGYNPYFPSGDTIGIYPMCIPTSPEFQITRLTMDELWLSYNSSRGKYFFKLIEFEM
ncbi:MAG: hypothetical protein A2W93_10265 [Bacteroidetes bacterium GWF2_43_63]|nr:MAG: hypothetical protein A2W94_02205 [Bacteroidetes bacterium GWE2_42_42]OFY52906.1 MAG: hypothetical protein A2W93_10265 [Bacteroidetes bacterium GWF2_43_63]HBG70113.1 hypothetical protein [Bacteroidales bacterium]HCB62280.1 hypothetical protein [Bacteroidales bacterium]